MKTKLFRLIVIISIFTILFVKYPVQAQNSFLYSVRAQKDPVNHSLNDYSDAESIPLNSNLFTKELYVKNSESNLYLALRIVPNQTLNGIALVFDVDHDQQYADDVKILYTNQTKNDGYFYLKSALSLQSQTFFSGDVTNITYIDGKTYLFFEFNIQFNPSSNPTTDMYISDPSDYMLGFDLVEIRNGSLVSWSRGNLGIENTINKLDSDASSFYTIILAGPGKYAVPDFNPVVKTNPPANQTYTASSSIAYKDNNQAISSASASPGFEFYFIIICLTTLIVAKKMRSRRQNK